jgi:hypothetical protein
MVWTDANLGPHDEAHGSIGRTVELHALLEDLPDKGLQVGRLGVEAIEVRCDMESPLKVGRSTAMRCLDHRGLSVEG